MQTAIEGENTAKISIANSDANRREKEADLTVAITAEKVQQAKALELAYRQSKKRRQPEVSGNVLLQVVNVVIPAEISSKKRSLRLRPLPKLCVKMPRAKLMPSMRKWRLRRGS